MTARRLSESLKGILPSARAAGDRDRAFAEFLDVCGPEWGSRLVNLGYTSGTLRIGVDSHADLQETQFHRKTWLAGLVKGGSRVRRLEFLMDPDA